jgi:hypothetical protein
VREEPGSFQVLAHVSKPCAGRALPCGRLRRSVDGRKGVHLSAYRLPYLPEIGVTYYSPCPVTIQLSRQRESFPL